MVGEKFFINVSSLSTTELNSCIRFSKVEVFNRREEITRTLEFFKRNKNKFFSLLNDEKKLFFIIFPNENSFIKKDLVDHFHYCIVFFEDFIINSRVQACKEKRLQLLEEFYSEKKLEKEFLAVNKKRIKLEKSKKINVDSNLRLYLMHKSKFSYLIKDFDNDVFNELDIAIDYLDKYYFLSKMNAFQELASNTLMNNVKYTHVLKDEIFEIIETESLKNDNLVYKLYKYTVQLYSNDFDLNRYYAFKELVIKNLDRFTVKSKKNLFSDLSNYVSYLYNRNADNSLIQESFDIIKMQIEHNTNVENNTFPESTFSQDIRIAIYLKEFEWAESFIETHKKYIRNKDVIIISKAEILYSQAKYDELYKIVDKLNKLNKKESYVVKSLYAKALYDQKKYDQLDTYLINFSKSLKRQKENSKKLLSSKNGFVKYLARLLKHLHNRSRLEVLQKELSENKHVFHRNWLISKLNSLLK